MSRHRWNYIADATASRHGLMVCSACHKPIESGAYRVRDAGDKFITMHRACSESDAGWRAFDAARLEADVTPTEEQIAAAMPEAGRLRERVEALGPDNAEHAIATALATRDAELATLRARLAALEAPAFKVGDRVTRENIASIPYGVSVTWRMGTAHHYATRIGPNAWECDGERWYDHNLIGNVPAYIHALPAPEPK